MQQQQTQAATIEDAAPETVPGAWLPVSEETIEGTVRQIIAQFDPECVILFGSYAYGKPRPGSDVDMLVVLATDRKESEQAVIVCREIDYQFPLDLIVRTPATLARRLELGDAFLSEVVGKGKVLYERPYA